MLIRFLIAGVVTVTLTTSGNNSAMLTNYVFDGLVRCRTSVTFYTNPRRNTRANNSSAVADMGDCGHTAENGGGAVPLLGGAGSPSNTMWPGPRPTCMPSFILIHPTVWPQYTNVTDRTYRTDRHRDSLMA